MFGALAAISYDPRKRDAAKLSPSEPLAVDLEDEPSEDGSGVE